MITNLKDLFQNCKSRQDIEKRIKNTLKDKVVVDNIETAKKWFKEAGDKRRVHQKIVTNKIVNIWNEEEGGNEVYAIYIFEYYTDSGSIDYLYSYWII